MWPFKKREKRTHCIQCGAAFGLISYPNDTRKFCTPECMAIEAEPPDRQLNLPLPAT